MKLINYKILHVHVYTYLQELLHILLTVEGPILELKLLTIQLVSRMFTYANPKTNERIFMKFGFLKFVDTCYAYFFIKIRQQ
jgi:hypothetical protein